MKLHSKQQGHGEDVITLHGLFGSLENLGMISRGLAPSFRMHGLDLRNHGRSPHAEAMNYRLMAEDVLTYMDDYGVENAHLIGHSMGGKVAMTLASLAPQRVNRLAVIDIAPVTYHTSRHNAILQGLSAMPLASLTSRNEADQFLAAYVPELAVRQFLLKNLYRTEHGSFAWRMYLSAIINHYQDIMDGQQGDRPFAGPTLFIKGETSDYILPEYKEQMLALFPAATELVIPGVGHWVHAQKPELVVDTLAKFLGSHQPE